MRELLFLLILPLLILSSFDEFIGNEEYRNLIEKYKQREIKTLDALLGALQEKGCRISIRTLYYYMKKIKDISAPEEADSQDLQIKECFSQKDNEQLYLIGKKNHWRKFYKTTETSDAVYLTCLECDLIQRKEKNEIPIVARVIVRGGRLDNSRPIVHHPNCHSEPWQLMLAEQYDRISRIKASASTVKLKSLWREGADDSRKIDATCNLDPETQDSVSFNYPDWHSARRSYNRRRQLAVGPINTDPYLLPEQLTLSKFGATKLVLGKKLNDRDIWLIHRNKEKGIMTFASALQLDAILNCKILVADATFELSPVPFRQIWTIHGLYETSSGSEWIALAFSLMESRTEETYLAAFEELFLRWQQRGELLIERIHVDYETAEINALSNILGQDKVFGCLVHFCRALIRNLQSTKPNMFRIYTQEKSSDVQHMRKWIRRIMALPLLRKPEIGRLWPMLKQIPRWPRYKHFQNEQREFVHYIERNWIRKSEPTNLWNFNNLARTRSTNPAEAYHSSIKRDPASIRHGSTSNFLHFFQIIMSDVDARIAKLQTGGKPRGRNRIYSELDERIAATLDEYETLLDAKFHDDADFELVSYRYLDRLEHLLIQMDDKGLRTKKEEKIKARKRKMDSDTSLTVVDDDPLTLCDQNTLVIGTDAPSVGSQSTVGPLALFISSEHREGEELDESQTYLFNPPSHLFHHEFCERWSYECAHILPTFAPVQEIGVTTGCGKRRKIGMDGNCGFRVLSFLLTGKEENHIEIRRNVIEFSQEEVRAHLNYGGHDWWQMLTENLDAYNRHLDDMLEPVTPFHGGSEKWAANVDFLAASKLFDVNIMVCSPYVQSITEQTIFWSRYVPTMQHSLLLAQDRSKPSIFIYFNGANHYEAILDPIV